MKTHLLYFRGIETEWMIWKYCIKTRTMKAGEGELPLAVPAPEATAAEEFLTAAALLPTYV